MECWQPHALLLIPTILLFNSMGQVMVPTSSHHNGRTVDHLLFGNHGNGYCPSVGDEGLDESCDEVPFNITICSLRITFVSV